MRDPDRIDEVLDSLQWLWIKHPDMRLCQLLTWVTNNKDTFNLEDDKLLELIEEKSQAIVDSKDIDMEVELEKVLKEMAELKLLVGILQGQLMGKEDKTPHEPGIWFPTQPVTISRTTDNTKVI